MFLKISNPPQKIIPPSFTSMLPFEIPVNCDPPTNEPFELPNINNFIETESVFVEIVEPKPNFVELIKGP